MASEEAKSGTLSGIVSNTFQQSIATATNFHTNLEGGNKFCICILLPNRDDASTLVAM